MSSFAIRKIDIISCEEDIFQVEINGILLLDEFENSLEKRYLSEYKTLLRYIEFFGNKERLPEVKFKILKGVGDEIPEYEFRGKHLRIYGIQLPNHKIILYCGLKSEQSRDLIKFRSRKIKILELFNRK